MAGKAPHSILLGALFGISEYTHLGASAVEHVLPHADAGNFAIVSEGATAFMLWLFLFTILPATARLVIRASEALARAVDHYGWWLRRRLADGLLTVAARVEPDGRA